MSTATATAQSRWRPDADIELLKLRAGLNAFIADFMAHRGVLAVETPLLSPAANPDPAVAPLTTADGQYLRTSPEFALKRLICAGSGPIYELGRVFRDGERGRLHQREFTMLEWYRPDLSMDQLMAEVASLINGALALTDLPTLTISHIEYSTLIEELLGRPLPEDNNTLRSLTADLSNMTRNSVETMDRDGCLDLLFSLAGQQLPPTQLSFVTHFPASQAALARTDPQRPSVALRFEAFAGGMELANGYDELTCAAELSRRFEADNQRRAEANLPLLPADALLVAAQRSGMPSCCGVSVGVDRLLMLISGHSHIRQVMSFAEKEA